MEPDRRRVWLWSAAAVCFVVGLILVWNDSAAGWMIIIIGLSYIGVASRSGQAWSAAHPGLARWGLVASALLLILLVVILGVVFLLK